MVACGLHRAPCRDLSLSLSLAAAWPYILWRLLLKVQPIGVERRVVELCVALSLLPALLSLGGHVVHELPAEQPLAHLEVHAAVQQMRVPDKVDQARGGQGARNRNRALLLERDQLQKARVLLDRAGNQGIRALKLLLLHQLELQVGLHVGGEILRNESRLHDSVGLGWVVL